MNHGWGVLRFKQVKLLGLGLGKVTCKLSQSSLKVATTRESPEGKSGFL